MRMGVDDEREAERYRIEDPVALAEANALASQWLRWGVVWACRKYGSMRGRVSLEDLEQAARMAVVFASREYDESRGHFPAFAKFFIKSEVTKLFARGGRDVSMPRDWKETIKPLECALKHMIEIGEEPDVERALNSLDVGETKKQYIRDVYQAAGRVGLIFEFNHGGTYDDDLASGVDSRQELERLEEALDKLPRFHREVLSDHYLKVPISETHKRLKISRQTIHNYRVEALEWVRYAMGAGPRPKERRKNGMSRERIDYAKFA